MRYDLEGRTIAFGKQVVLVAKKIPQTSITRPLISQIVRSGTSVGANYREADSAGSKKEFAHRISICRKEANETCYWLSMLQDVVPELNNEFEVLSKEAQELVFIFSKIHRTTRASLKKENDIRH